MRIFYNPDIRQLIVFENKYAFSVYLQSNEQPLEKAIELIDKYSEFPKDMSTCQEIEHDERGHLLPVEDGLKEFNPPAINKTIERDGKTN